MEPIKLDINTQKDQIIARLLLQRFYSTSYSGMYSKAEIDHIVNFTLKEDQIFYDKAYDAVISYNNCKGYEWLVN